MKSLVRSSQLVRIFIFALALGLSSCASKKKGAESMSADGKDSMSGDGNYMSRMAVGADSDSGEAGMLKTIFFAYDSALLSSEAKDILSANAKFLKENSSLTVQIEGHCDERGGVQYNIALGQKRAESVRSFLTALGVKSSALSTISFGKERPLAFGHNEEAWSQNRRANFVVTAK